MEIVAQTIPETWVIPGWVLYATAVLFLAILVVKGLTIAINFWRGGTTNVVEDMQDDGLLPTQEKWETLLSDVSEVRDQQIEFGQKLDNGIIDRLDGLDLRHATLDTKIDGLVLGLGRLEGMMQASEGTEVDGN